MTTQALSLAASQAGLDENAQNAALQEYLANGGVNLDPAVTAWCAAFVNATLQQTGQKGTGSNMARSFLEWGTGVDATAAQPGDIAVFPRGDPNGPYGHVGFIEQINSDGTVTLLGGNQGNAVSRDTYSLDNALGIRRGENALASVQPQAPESKQNPLAWDYQAVSLDPRAFQSQPNPMAMLDINSLVRQA